MFVNSEVSMSSTRSDVALSHSDVLLLRCKVMRCVPPPHARSAFHCRRQFHTRQRISLVPQERISLKKAIRNANGFFHGLPERILNHALALRGQKAPRSNLHFWILGASTLFLGLSNRPNQKTPTSGAFWFGLPERIRTFDLQSRSLTRYPAVPRVGICFIPCYYTINLSKLQPLFQKK